MGKKRSNRGGCGTPASKQGQHRQAVAGQRSASRPLQGLLSGGRLSRSDRTSAGLLLDCNGCLEHDPTRERLWTEPGEATANSAGMGPQKVAHSCVALPTDGMVLRRRQAQVFSDCGGPRTLNASQNVAQRRESGEGRPSEGYSAGSSVSHPMPVASQ